MGKTDAERFWEKVDKDRPDGCWFWLAATTGGYGVIRIGGRLTRAHRWAYEEAQGPIPDGFVLDHLCGQSRCVNPMHLEPLTQKENVRRGGLMRPTHCRNGHERTESNTFITPEGHRTCLTCRRDKQRRSYEEQRAAEGQKVNHPRPRRWPK